MYKMLHYKQKVVHTDKECSVIYMLKYVVRDNAFKCVRFKGIYIKSPLNAYTIDLLYNALFYRGANYVPEIIKGNLRETRTREK